jgi:Zn-finger nucleic acid-binding protein
MVSVLFGKSSIVIDWCPQCHGMWLDQDEFDSVTEYLKHELHGMHSKEMEKKGKRRPTTVLTNGGVGYAA